MSELVTESLTKEYPTEEGALVVFRHCSFRVSGGQSLALVGPSGSGKSTMLAILGGLELPTSGRVLLDAKDLTDLSSDERTRFRRDSVGFVFQDHCLMPHLTAWENVMLPVLASRSESRADSERVEMLFDRIHLTDRKNHFPAQLSGGQRQRLALARALVRQPQLLLADEPTGNLDRANAQNIAALLFQLAQTENVILVLATHDTNLAACADHILDLSRIESPDTPSESSIEFRG